MRWESCVVYVYSWDPDDIVFIASQLLVLFDGTTDGRNALYSHRLVRHFWYMDGMWWWGSSRMCCGQILWRGLEIFPLFSTLSDLPHQQWRQPTVTPTPIPQPSSPLSHRTTIISTTITTTTTAATATTVAATTITKEW